MSDPREFGIPEPECQQAHSPLPWRQEHRECADKNYRTQVIDARGSEVATLAWNPVHGNGVIWTNRAENAEFIVRACNSHDALVATLKEFVLWCEDGALSGSDREMFIQKFSTAIAQAEGREATHDR